MVGEKASPAKKNPRLRLTLFAVVALIVVERRAFNSLLPRIFSSSSIGRRASSTGGGAFAGAAAARCLARCLARSARTRA